MKTMERPNFSKEAAMQAPRAVKIDPFKAGSAVGGVSAIFHAGWALLVALGWAQPFMDFMFQLHFLQPLYFVGVFDMRLAACLVATAAAGGFVMGAGFAILWNALWRTDAA